MSLVQFKVDGSIYNKENLNKKYIDNGNLILCLEHPVLKKFFQYKIIHGIHKKSLEIIDIKL